MSEQACDRCEGSGRHLCAPRARRVVRVFEEVLVHTKGDYARAPFILAPWQRSEIVEPLFGTVEWSSERRRWVRTYRLAWLELARKNGKSDLMAGFALVLLCADDEEGAEVYGAAKDRDQAGLVFKVAERMVELSPALSKRLRIYRQQKRIVFDKYGSWYQVVAADAGGNLGSNPHGVIFDEVLTQPNRDLWDAFRSGMGARSQPLMVAATTASNDPSGFCAQEHAYCERIRRDPSLDPRRLLFMRNTPDDADPWDEANWPQANPALGDFLSLEYLRDRAAEARADPVKENAFRQLHLNQYVQQVTRWIPMHLWDACGEAAVTTPEALNESAAKQRCYGGLDLSSTTDLTALCWLFPALGNLALWRFWLPEEVGPFLEERTAGAFSTWVRAGWITLCPGATIDYEPLYEQVAADKARFRVADLGYDRAMAAPVIRELEKIGVPCVQVSQGFALTTPMNELMRLLKAGGLRHGGNPVARWNAEAVEVRQDDQEHIKLVKPARGASAKRIDGIAALVMAVDGAMRRGGEEKPRRVVGF